MFKVGVFHERHEDFGENQLVSCQFGHTITIPFCLFSYMYFQWEIHKNYKKLSTPNIIGILDLVVMTRNAVYNNHNSLLHYLGVIALCYTQIMSIALH